MFGNVKTYLTCPKTGSYRAPKTQLIISCKKGYSTYAIAFSLFMQKKGVEPSRYCYHTDLNRARLPIPPLLQTIVAANIFIASMLISITHCLINVNCFLNYLFFLFYFNFIQYILIKHKHNPSKLIYIFNKYYYLYCFGLQKQYINILLHLMLLFI